MTVVLDNTIQHFQTLTGLKLKGVELVMGLNIFLERVDGIVEAAFNLDAGTALGAGKLEAVEQETLERQTAVFFCREALDQFIAASTPALLRLFSRSMKLLRVSR